MSDVLLFFFGFFVATFAIPALFIVLFDRT